MCFSRCQAPHVNNALCHMMTYALTRLLKKRKCLARLQLSSCKSLSARQWAKKNKVLSIEDIGNEGKINSDLINHPINNLIITACKNINVNVLNSAFK